jgi:hypothetical protein
MGGLFLGRRPIFQYNLEIGSTLRYMFAIARAPVQAR